MPSKAEYENSSPLNSDLKRAIEQGFPEAIVPEEVVTWMMGYENETDDLTPIKLGCRYSPKSIRAMTLSLCNGIFTEEGYYSPPNPQFRQNVAAYSYFNDFISAEEYALLAKGKAIYGNLPSQESDVLVSPNSRLIANSVHPTIEEVGVILENKRKENPDLKVVLFDGKFNGVPHPGYILLFRDTTQELVMSENVKPENIVFVVACATDNYIRLTGGIPFLSSAWRMSLMSYLPWPDYICASGEFDQNGGLKHWIYKTQALWPDYVSIEDNHPLRESKIIQARSAGVKVLTHRRTGVFYPSEVGKPKMDRLKGPEISSRNINDGVVGRETEYSYSNPYAHMFAIKQIRDDLYGKRSWFSGQNILQLADVNKIKVPAEWKIEELNR